MMFHIYAARDADNSIVYIGKGRLSRVRRQKRPSGDVSKRLGYVPRVEILWSGDSEKQALYIERELIILHQPKFNTAKDGGSRGFTSKAVVKSNKRRVGWHHSIASRRAIAAAKLGKTRPQWHRAAMRVAWIKRKLAVKK